MFMDLNLWFVLLPAIPGAKRMCTRENILSALEANFFLG